MVGKRSQKQNKTYLNRKGWGGFLSRKRRPKLVYMLFPSKLVAIIENLGVAIHDETDTLLNPILAASILSWVIAI